MRYILLTALRDWLFAALVIGVVGCSLVSHMLGGTALIEMQEMTLAYTSASARVVVITGLIIFVCFHIRNAFDTKEIDVFLSRPITRSNLVLSYWIGFATVALLLVIPMLVLLVIQGIPDVKGFIFWSLSEIEECWLIVAVALFFAFTLKSAVTSTLASMGFYVFTRMIGFFIADSQSETVLDSFWAHALKWISLVLPRLDSFAKSDWLIYGVKNMQDIKIFIAQTGIFILLLVLATIADFKRKQF